jgi:mono/diheme cytochrome c family protein
MRTLTTMIATACLLAGCAGAWQNTGRLGQSVGAPSTPAGSVYTGWRVYQAKCADCHGALATGSSVAPDLLASMRGMGPRRFVGLVLQRYDWNRPAGQAAPVGSPRETLIDDALAGRESPLAMPAWQDEPAVTAHIADLYAYLSARADGTQGPGRPNH